MRLGGWCRLFVVASLLWGAVVVAGAVLRFPPPNAEQVAERYTHRLFDRLVLLDVADPPTDRDELAELLDGFLQRFLVASGVGSSHVDFLTNQFDERCGNILCRNNGSEVGDSLNALWPDYQADLTGLPGARLRYYMSLLAWWAGPMAGVAALGGATVWVARGFRPHV